MHGIVRKILAAGAIACTGAGALAQGDAPDALPATGYGAAHAAVEAGDWDLAYLLAESEGSIARDLVTWARLRDGAGTFADYQTFLLRRAEWPDQSRLRERAEESIPDYASDVDVLSFFAEDMPVTGDGAVALARALRSAGRGDRADVILIETWLGTALSDRGFDAMMEAHADFLAPFHEARVEAMLWRWRVSDAQRLLGELRDEERALAEARIALIRGAADVNDKLAAVPASLRNHPALAYDQFNRLADRGDYTEATAILQAHTGSPETLGQPFRWASWRASLARWHMREGRPDLAYDLARQHFLTEGSFYADLEWLAGYIALRYQDDPAKALAHFTNMSGAVDSPISTARAQYWIGRAHIQRQDATAATEALSRAAEHQTAFYGLLASELLGRPLDPELAATHEVPDWGTGPVAQSDMVQGMMFLLDAGDRGAAYHFAVELGRALDRDGLLQLGRELLRRDEVFFTVILGKSAAARGMILPEIYFPLHPLAEMESPVAPELALSIARRESEFRADAGSPVGALGLMQIMPATAEEVAGKLAMGYSRGRLTSDWRYNAVLGTAYLAELEQTFGPSPVMIAAGYNAGPSRPATWMTERGDPRKGEIDVVDWIEHIPFTETRNYVMRVTESIPVYRARLTGEAGPLRFTELLNGAPPFVRPRARPSPEALAARAAAEAAEAARAAEIAAAAAENPAPMRPVARPGG